MKHLRLGIHRQPTLRMEQRAFYPHGAEGRRKLRNTCEITPEHVASPGDLEGVHLGHGRFERRSVEAELARQFKPAPRRNQRALCLGEAEILELPGYPRDTDVENRISRAARLTRDARSLLGIALGFVRKALAIAIDLHATFGDRGPGDQDAMGMRHGAMPLMAGEITRRGTQGLAP